MKKTSFIPLVLFNASVILAGLASPKGGSAKLLKLVKNGKLRGVISEIILDEVVRRAAKLGLSESYAEKEAHRIFKKILFPPDLKSVNLFIRIVKDPGDAHVLASATAVNADYLVCLDKKHILTLKNKVKKFHICSPKELIEQLARY